MRSKLPKPRYSFPIRCDRGKSRLFYRVIIFNNAADLQRHASITRYHSLRRLAHTKGLSAPFKKQRMYNKQWHTLPICGEILFTHTYLNAMVIAHECGHAALAWCARRKLTYTDAGEGNGFVADGEERFCYVLGNLVGELYWQLHRRGYQTVRNHPRHGRVFA